MVIIISPEPTEGLNWIQLIQDCSKITKYSEKPRNMLKNVKCLFDAHLLYTYIKTLKYITLKFTILSENYLKVI